MTVHLVASVVLAAALLVAGPPGPATAAPPPQPSRAAASPGAQPARAATGQRTPGPHTATVAGGARSAGVTPRSGGPPRRLEDIHIEGEIPAPQVLFISARDQRRFVESSHRRYLPTARDLGEATPRLTSVVVRRAPADPR